MLYIKWVSGRLQDKANITLIANEVEAFYTNVNGDGNLVHTVQCNHTLEKIIGQIRSGAPDSRILLISPIWLGENVWNRDSIRNSQRNLSMSQSIWQKFIVRLRKKKIFHFLMRLHIQNQVQPIRNIWTLRIIDCWQRQFIKK